MFQDMIIRRRLGEAVSFGASHLTASTADTSRGVNENSDKLLPLLRFLGPCCLAHGNRRSGCSKGDHEISSVHSDFLSVRSMTRDAMFSELNA